jgi:hypothetical protein
MDLFLLFNKKIYTKTKSGFCVDFFVTISTEINKMISERQETQVSFSGLCGILTYYPAKSEIDI